MGCNCGRRKAAAATTATATTAPATHSHIPTPSVRRPGQRRYPAAPPPPPPPPPPLLPSVWGPPLWTALHTAAQFTTTESQRLVWIDLLTAMRTALPCDECSAHYNAWIDAHPVALLPSGPVPFCPPPGPWQKHKNCEDKTQARTSSDNKNNWRTRVFLYCTSQLTKRC